MKVIILTVETAPLVLEALSEITKNQYFTVENGYSEEEVNPLSKPQQINWSTESKNTFRNNSARRGNDDNFDIILLSRTPSHSVIVFEKGSKVYLSENQVIFQRPMSEVSRRGKFGYQKISLETKNAEQKFVASVQTLNDENKRIYDVGEENECSDFFKEEAEDKMDNIIAQSKITGNPHYNVYDEKHCATKIYFYIKDYKSQKAAEEACYEYRNSLPGSTLKEICLDHTNKGFFFFM